MDGNQLQVVEKDGERGRNRTYNLLIKSQLLCQLSYAPTANGTVGTNFDYSIGLALFCSWLRPISAASLDAILIFGRNSGEANVDGLQLRFPRKASPAARDLRRAIFYNCAATFRAMP